MYNEKIKKFSFAAYVSGGIAIVCLVTLLILMGAAGWNMWEIDPAWLGFLLLTVAGISLALTCVFVYLIILWKERAENTVVCSSCGEYCSVDAGYCPNCGVKLADHE